MTNLEKKGLTINGFLMIVVVIGVVFLAAYGIYSQRTEPRRQSSALVLFCSSPMPSRSADFSRCSRIRASCSPFLEVTKAQSGNRPEVGQSLFEEAAAFVARSEL